MAEIALIDGEQIDDIAKVDNCDVPSVADADALVTDVKDPKTFYSVAAPRKTGTMPTVALDPASSAYPAGYHAGNVGGLPAIDADLVTANIKSGKTIFNVAGAATVQDISDADLTVAEAPTGKKFYAVTGGVKTGTGTKTLDPASEVVAAGYYAATTLSAVDADLAVGNIKSGVNIFGKVGTYAQALAEDVEGDTFSVVITNVDSPGHYQSIAVATGVVTTLVTKTLTYNATSLAFAAGHFCGYEETPDCGMVLQLYMGGVLMQASAELSSFAICLNVVLRDFKALSGSQICKLCAYQTTGAARALNAFGGENTSQFPIAIAVGSVKLV